MSRPTATHVKPWTTVTSFKEPALFPLEIARGEAAHSKTYPEPYYASTRSLFQNN